MANSRKPTITVTEGGKVTVQREATVGDVVGVFSKALLDAGSDYLFKKRLTKILNTQDKEEEISYDPYLFASEFAIGCLYGCGIFGVLWLGYVLGNGVGKIQEKRMAKIQQKKKHERKYDIVYGFAAAAWLSSGCALVAWIGCVLEERISNIEKGIVEYKKKNKKNQDKKSK